ncbi:MAG: 2-oxoglutarate dehydrogenase E1 component [Legionellales bacterium]|nr:2-oxoglutarate dehydrogenase E1 component [Legionellales bacterium]
MTDNYTKYMQETSHISGGNAAYIDSLYEDFLLNPEVLPQQWRDYFAGLPNLNGQSEDEVSHEQIRQYFTQQAKLTKHYGATAAGDVDHERKQMHVAQLINAYRLHGHHDANLDPLNKTERKVVPDLTLQHHHLSELDFDTMFVTESHLTSNGTSLREIYQSLRKTYSNDLGFEYMHITNHEQVAWLQQRIESVQAHPGFSTDRKKLILKQLTEAEGLEKYLGSKYVGQKRFSLEGGDSLIPMLHSMVNLAGEEQVRELVIGMAHRGRLNVLINVLGKSPQELFQEFEGKHDYARTGDVKYHMGFSSNVRTQSDDIVHLALAFNPSHLEIISPVVEGSVRSRQRRRQDLVEKKQVVPILIHGDAAFAGQGVVMETFNFSQARGYCTGGTVHIVVNNQIGFTTSNPLDARSTLYCTDVAKMVQAPVIHVNGDNPEAVVFAAELAFEFRMKFKHDVVIDLVCYRRHGHNEADEPAITQPKMYAAIKQLPTVRTLYADQLVQQKVITSQAAEAMVLTYRDLLDRGESVVKLVTDDFEGKYSVNWSPFVGKAWTESADTRVAKKTLAQLAEQLLQVPEGFQIHPVVQRLMDERHQMSLGKLPVNWGYAETLAFASLVHEGHTVRMSGQDCGRGTFAHRHAVLHDCANGDVHIPLQHLSGKRDQFIIIDSILSEEAVLGFEYGFAASEPNALVIWEAQFGDFVNGAQVVIDQFISSGEQKWGKLCGLTMLLPHGFEGQGPEHSSARLERFLQLCAQHNIQVCVPTTPAQAFHMLRRQVIRPFRKPLVVMTPKSLLRHKLAVSSLDDLATGKFHNVIPEIDDLDPKKVRKVVLCSGKVYYDLLQQRRDQQQTDVALIRIEQLYPFPKDELRDILTPYRHVQEVVWCQEEPQNQGAWYASQHNMLDCLQEDQSLTYVGRGFFAAPAVGSFSLHNEQQKELVEQALA